MNNRGEQRRGQIWNSSAAPPPGAYGFFGNHDRGQQSNSLQLPTVVHPQISGHGGPTMPDASRSSNPPRFQQCTSAEYRSVPLPSFPPPPAPQYLQSGRRALQHSQPWNQNIQSFPQVYPQPPPLPPPSLAPLPPFPRLSSVPISYSSDGRRPSAALCGISSAATHTRGDAGRPITDPSLDPAVQRLLAEAEHKLRMDNFQQRDVSSAVEAALTPWLSTSYLEGLDGRVALLEAVIRECEELEDHNRNPDSLGTGAGAGAGGTLEHEEALRLAREAVGGLEGEVRRMVAPLERALDERGVGVEVLELAAAVSRRERANRKKRWKRKRRRQVAQAREEEGRRRKELDEVADEWRARELAKGIAERKMNEMVAAAEKAGQEERRRTEQELEALLMLERVKELRALRVEKRRRQGHLLPDEDDTFMARVLKSVEEEDRAAGAAEGGEDGGDTEGVQAGVAEGKGEAQEAIGVVVGRGVEEGGRREEGVGGGRGTHGSSLGPEMYHFYFGSEHSMDRLIEVGMREGRRTEGWEGGWASDERGWGGGGGMQVRRQWDAFLSPSGR